VKHAGAPTLAHLAPLLASVREVAGAVLVERKAGTFYKRGAAFLHFHEDAAGLFADLKGDDGWERLQVDSAAQRAALLRRIKARL
jgi:hypothetical protein